MTNLTADKKKELRRLWNIAMLAKEGTKEALTNLTADKKKELRRPWKISMLA